MWVFLWCILSALTVAWITLAILATVSFCTLYDDDIDKWFKERRTAFVSGAIFAFLLWALLLETLV